MAHAPIIDGKPLPVKEREKYFKDAKKARYEQNNPNRTAELIDAQLEEQEKSFKKSK